MKKLFIVLLLTYCFNPQESYSWDGYDYETGSYVEIEKDNLVREGETIEMDDY